MSVDTIFVICWIMFKCLYLISFKHGFLQTYSSRRIFWYKQFYVFSITPKTSTVPLDDVVVSHDLVGRIVIILWFTLFSWLDLGGLVGSSSELTSWIALFGVVIFNSISFSSLWAADVSCWTFDGIADAEFNFLDSFVCSEACAGKVISHNWKAELVDGLFCIDFWALIV